MQIYMYVLSNMNSARQGVTTKPHVDQALYLDDLAQQNHI